jgi:hypothetical protein
MLDAIPVEMFALFQETRLASQTLATFRDDVSDKSGLESHKFKLHNGRRRVKFLRSPWSWRANLLRGWRMRYGAPRCMYAASTRHPVTSPLGHRIAGRMEPQNK